MASHERMMTEVGEGIGGRYIGPARECESTDAECDRPTYEYEDGWRMTWHLDGGCPFGEATVKRGTWQAN